MIWHVAKLDFSNVPAAERDEVHRLLAELPNEVPGICWLRVGPDLTNPDLSVLVSAFPDRESLEAYRHHPRHRPAQEALHGSGAKLAELLDIQTDDDSGSPFPATALPAP